MIGATQVSSILDDSKQYELHRLNTVFESPPPMRCEGRKKDVVRRGSRGSESPQNYGGESGFLNEGNTESAALWLAA